MQRTPLVPSTVLARAVVGAVGLVGVTACAAQPTPAPPSSSTASASSATPPSTSSQPSQPSAPSSTSPAPAPRAYFDLAAAAVKTTDKDGPPRGLYVDGAVQDGGFVPSSDVLGEGAIGARGHPGYLELSTGAFMRAEEARAPVAPYVEGTMTAQGFVPGSRKVVRFAR